MNEDFEGLVQAVEEDDMKEVEQSEDSLDKKDGTQQMEKGD